MALFWGPVLVSVWVMARHQLAEPHRIAHPPWEWLGLPAFGLLFVVGAAAALSGLSMATIPARAEIRVRA
ncbi:hypothetical protein ACIA8K_31440 [Catenuloplanes sp. NPDC051500]|uniref:hypothetical protein n=1 Tax=Catenuloplanes sp. NPDC051500 TaxID=3363959 RepID=UPI0037A63F44